MEAKSTDPSSLHELVPTTVTLQQQGNIYAEGTHTVLLLQYYIGFQRKFSI